MRLRGLAAALILLSAAPILAQQQPQTGAVTAPGLTQSERAPVMRTQPLVIETPAPEAGQAYPPIMTIDQDELFMKSRWGLRVQADLEARGRAIAAENERLASQFAAEEQELANLRGALPPDEFRNRADEFDKRVVEVRRERDTAARDLQSSIDEERTAFFNAALPVLAQLMKERGAVAVLDQRAIFVSAQSADVTGLLIDRLNSEIGAGPMQPATRPTTATPEQSPAPSAP